MIYNFKSNEEFYFKEKNGFKPNTVRFLDLNDFRIRISRGDMIRIRLSEDENEYFEREVTDKSHCGNVLGKNMILISWKHEEVKK